MRQGQRYSGARTVLVTMLLAIACVPATADTTSSQRQAAEEYLAAVASGDARAMSMAIHEPELELLRKRLLDEMKLEADRNENLIRGRLFGLGLPLAEIERMTAQNFFVTLAARLRFASRPFDRVEWLDAVKDDGSMVHLVGRLRPLREQGSVRVPVLVTLVPWGKDWKAALPIELQAQIDDLRSGRTRSAAPATAATPGAPAVPTPAATEVHTLPLPIAELFNTAEENLKAGRCEDYYERQMSPHFRRTLAPKALRSLITTCEGRTEVRERHITALQIARGLAPRYEYSGTRAVFDLRGKGLPFNQLVLEQVDKRWFIAE